ncbi:MAG: preprotein translocase subunit SecE [Actinobacteria bacterium]|nr:preprotein translocase subunit SecE [Actinomycetota bacterium]
MAKPAKIKKDQDAAPAKKGGKKAVAKGKDSAAKGKGAAGKGVKEEPKGFKARVAKAQAAKQTKPAKGGGAKEKKGAAQFLREVKVEMGKVTWPGREELIQSTMVVLLAVVVAGTFIAILDLVFSRLIGLIS